MNTSDFYYELPKGLIAQAPAVPRDASRLLVFDRTTGAVQHSHFRYLHTFLDPGDLLVINQTRVIPGRLIGKKIPTGGKTEALLLRQVNKNLWESLIGGKRLRVDQSIRFKAGLEAEIVKDLGGPRRLLQFNRPVEKFLEKFGEIPLPPYIQQNVEDPELYQTIYSSVPGSAAAPTAGLHFTIELMERLNQSGVNIARITLHIGLDTFVPVATDDPRNHDIHSEWCQILPEVAQMITRTKESGKRVVAVGTTSVRTLETAGGMAPKGKSVGSFEGPTDLFILPGYHFKVVDAMVTNFHLPKTSLLMLVSAFVNREKVLELYELAISQSYRFYSFGDAMLIL